MNPSNGAVAPISPAGGSVEYISWSPDQIASRRTAIGLVGPGPQSNYPAPTFPGYVSKQPASVDDALPAAREAVRQTEGRCPLGSVKAGQTVLWVPRAGADPIVQEALRIAFIERGVDPITVGLHELLQVGERELAEVIAAEATALDISAGQKELYFMGLTGDFADYQKALDWFKEQNTTVYDATWPEVGRRDDRLRHWQANEIRVLPRLLASWLHKHREVADRTDAIFAGAGGRPGFTNGMVTDGHDYGTKFLGNFVINDHYDLLSKAQAFPPELWKLIERKTIEPLALADRLEFSDPMGTAYACDIDAETATDWAKGAYCPGHLFVFPTMGLGGHPYGFLDPADAPGPFLQPRQLSVSGVIAGTNSHMATHPQMEIWLKDGYVTDVTGGGLYGDGFRTWLNYPGINDQTWPFMEKPGFWWLNEGALATNPLHFKHPLEVLQGSNLSEREAGGVVHHAFGIAYRPDSEAEQDEWDAFSRATNLPMDHGMHVHQLFPTVQIRLRTTGQWVTLVEHGILTATSDADVRQLAETYGCADDLLARAWVPDIPGINAPGDYIDDYAKNPGQLYWIPWAKSIEAGTYPYLSNK